jgi:hypothetical protein
LIPWLALTQETVAQRIDEELGASSSQPRAPTGRIIKISPGEVQSHMQKVGEILEVVDHDLGGDGGARAVSDLDQSLYIYVSQRRVIG